MSSLSKTWYVVRDTWNVFSRTTFHAPRFTAILLAGLLTACGFEPMYGEKPASNPSRLAAGVMIDPIAGRAGQIFRIDLEDRLNPPGGVPARPAYRLNLNLTNSITPIGVARDGTVSTYNVYLTSKYVLYRNEDGKAINAGTVSYVVSYNNIPNAYFSTYIAEGDAIKRGLTELSELYRQRLGAYLDAGAVPQPIEPSDLAPLSVTPSNPWQNNPWQSAPPATAPRL